MWARTANAATFTSGTPFVPFQADLLSDFNTRYGADALGLTIARIRGIMFMDLVEADAPGQLCRVGIRVGAEGEVASTEFNPCTNGKYLDWMLFEPFLAADQGFAQQDAQVSARVIDNKANRKLEELDQTLFLYAGAPGPAADTVQIAYDLSILLMLP